MTFKCEAFAIPNPVYSWFKNGKAIQDDRYLITNTSLKINNLKLDDAANFSCLAENNLGRIENNFTLIVLSNNYFISSYFVVKLFFSRVKFLN